MIKTITSPVNSGQDPTWLNEFKQTAITEFKGLPNEKDEDWLYTDVQSIANQEVSTATKQDAQSSTAELVMVNGFVGSVANREGITITRFADLATQPDIKTTIKENAFSTLNAFRFEDGVEVKINKTQQQPYIIDCQSISSELSIEHPRILINIAANVTATIGIQHTGTSNTFVNAVFECQLAEGATLNMVDWKGSQSKVMHNIRIDQQKDSQCEYISFYNDGDLFRSDIDVHIHDSGAHCELKGVSLLKGETHSHQHIKIHHHTPGSTSNQLFKTILTDQSVSEFTGLVFVKEKSHETDSGQLNQNLMLSDSARVISRPQLKIDADDVTCAHGCTVGQLNPEEVFYITSRGMNEKQAKSLLTYGFAEEVIECITIDTFRNELESILKDLVDGYVDQ